MSGTSVEVTGVPNILSDDRMEDKLTIHFLRPRNGGGEVKRVLFPSYRPGQAFVIFEEAAGKNKLYFFTSDLFTKQTFKLLDTG